MNLRSLTCAALFLAAPAASNGYPEANETYILVPSLTSPDAPPAVIRTPARELNWPQMDLLGEAWRLLEFLRVDVVLSPELASKLSVANTEKGRHGMSWSDVNEAGLKRNIVGSDNADRLVDVIRQAITTFEKKTKLDVHLEPIYLATMWRTSAQPDDKVRVTLVEGDASVVRDAAQRVTGVLLNQSLVVPKKDLPRKVAELWRGYLREDQSIKVVSYDPELNLLIVRASEAWLKDFLAQWVAAGR